MSDKITVALTDNGGFRIYSAITTDLVNEAQKIHKSYPVATAALGRALTAGAIIGFMGKEDATVTLQFKGDGPLGTVLVVGNTKAEVKGYVANPFVDLPLNSKGKLDVGGGIGQGYLSVVRDNNGGTPYTGQVQLVSGEIAEDLTYYYATSEQIPTVIALGVKVNPDNTVKSAGGYVIQMMPGNDPDDEKIITQIENAVATLPSVSTMIENGNSGEEIISALMGDVKFGILNETTPKYKCDCSLKRVERALISIGKKDLQSIIDDGQGTTVDCHFCNKSYSFTTEQLKELSINCKTK